MALPWVDFLWTIRRYLRSHPQDFNGSLPSSTPAAGNYTLTDTDYSLVSTNASNVTWTIPSPHDNDGHVYRIKVQGAGNVTLSSPYIFTDIVESSLILVKGDMVSLRSDGSYWNVGD